MQNKRKKDKSNLKNYYTIFLQTGIIVTLLVFILAVKVQWQGESNGIDMTMEQELIEMEEVIQTQQEEKPPTPPRPQVPVEVPDDEIIEDQIINLDADMNLDDPLEMPPPPEEEKEEENFFYAVEQMPKLIGGIDKLHDRVNYPERARRAGIEGRVTIQFIVTENGDVEDPKVLRGIGGGCDEEALRVIKEAEYIPGRQREKAVRVKVAQTIYFRLQN